MYYLLFSILFLSLKSFSMNQISDTSCTIKEFKVITDGNLDIKKALLEEASLTEEISIQEGDSFWLLFDIYNDTTSSKLSLEDKLNKISSYVQEIFVLRDNKVLEKVEIGSSIVIPVDKKSSATVALKVASHSGNYEAMLRAVPINHRRILLTKFNVCSVIIILLMLCLVFILASFVNSRSVILLFSLISFFAFEQIIKNFFSYNMLKTNRIFVSIYLSIIFYSILFFLIEELFGESIAQKRKEQFSFLLYLIWIFAILSSLFSSHLLFAYKLYYLIRASIVLLIAISSLEAFLLNYSFKYILLFISYLFLGFIISLKALYLFGFISLKIFLWFYFTKIVYIIPNLFLIYVLYSNIKSRVRLELLMNSNSSLCFSSLKGAKQLKDAIFNYINESKRALYFDSVKIFLDSKEGLQFYASIPNNQGLSISYVKNLVLNMPKDRVIISNNIDKNREIRQFLPSSLYTSIMIVPLNLNGKYLGSMVFLSSKFNSFGNQEEKLASDISYKAAIVLNIYRQMEIINIYNKKLQFEEAIRMFQKNTAHDIKSPLRGLKSVIQIIKPKYTQDEFLAPFLDHMNQAVDSAIEQVKESVSLAIEESTTFTTEYLVEELDDLRKLSELEGIGFVQINNFYDDIHGPKKAIRNIVRGVVKNAIEALEFLDKENREVNIKYTRIGDFLNVMVRDNGKGLSKTAKDKMFGIYTENKKDGSGYGLMLAQYIAEKLGGSLEIDSVENEYTVVNIRIKMHN